jgi:hypothetical protein
VDQMCAVKMDVISPAELGKAVAVALEAFGHFDVVVNNSEPEILFPPGILEGGIFELLGSRPHE